MQQLYKIADEYTEAFNRLEEMDFDEQTIEDSLALVKDEFNNKAINIGSFIKNIESNIKAMKEAESSIADRRKALQNKIDSIKEYLKVNMEKCNITHIHSPYFDIKLKKNPAALYITNEKLIDKKYFDTIPATKVLNKEKLKNELKSKQAIDVWNFLKKNNCAHLEWIEKQPDDYTPDEILELSKNLKRHNIVFGCSLEQKNRVEIK